MVKTLFHLFSFLPLWLLHVLGAALGAIVYVLAPSYRRKMRAYSRMVFKDDEIQRRRAMRDSVFHTGMALLELPFLWGRPTHKGIRTCMEITGWEHVDAAKREGVGLVFLTPHQGCFEAAAQMFSTKAPITVLYRPNRNAEVQKIIEASRTRDNIEIAPTNVSGVKKLLRALKKGEAVGMLPDQVPSGGEGVWASAFGQPAYTMTLPARLVHATQAKIILALGVRIPFRGFRLELYPGPTELSEDPIEAATQVNSAIEKLIMQKPGQYYWGYERFKSPKGYVGDVPTTTHAVSHSVDSAAGHSGGQQ